MSLLTRKPVFGVYNQVRHKPAYAATDARWRLEIWDIETRGIILSRQRTTKALVRLRGCAGRSAPLLFAYGKSRFCHDVAHIRHTSKLPDATENFKNWIMNINENIFLYQFLIIVIGISDSFNKIFSFFFPGVWKFLCMCMGYKFQCLMDCIYGVPKGA